ncbi:hypothetical protein [Xanthobacter sp. KR7-225]|uniref:hypothetical protein n=1 Tax=Xanthobacter sp. KR7-225 TaxID=3156613 RepID=UPI0032B5DE31
MATYARRLFCAAAFASVLVAAPAAEASMLQRIQMLRSSSVPLVSSYRPAMFGIGPGTRTLLAFRAYSYDRYLSIVFRRPVSAFCRFFC